MSLEQHCCRDLHIILLCAAAYGPSYPGTGGYIFRHAIRTAPKVSFNGYSSSMKSSLFFEQSLIIIEILIIMQSCVPLRSIVSADLGSEEG